MRVIIMAIKNLKMKLIGYILMIIIFGGNFHYSNAESSYLIYPPLVCDMYYGTTDIVIKIGDGTCEYYYIFASESPFREYDKSFLRLERSTNYRCLNSEVEYIDSEYDYEFTIGYWRLPSEWSSCYFGVVCVNESSDLWSYPIISQKISIPEGLEPPDLDPQRDYGDDMLSLLKILGGFIFIIVILKIVIGIFSIVSNDSERDSISSDKNKKHKKKKASKPNSFHPKPSTTTQFNPNDSKITYKKKSREEILRNSQNIKEKYQQKFWKITALRKIIIRM